MTTTAAVAERPEPRQRTIEIRNTPDAAELNAIKKHLADEFRGSVVRYLYNTDNCYRLRLNVWNEREDGEPIISLSHFIVATATPDGISYFIKKDDSRQHRLFKYD